MKRHLPFALKSIPLVFFALFLLAAKKCYSQEYRTNFTDEASFTNYLQSIIPSINQKADLGALLHFNTDEDVTCDFDEQVCKSLPANSTSPRIISCKEISCVFHYRTTNECIPSYQEMGGSYNLIYRDGKITRTNSVDEIPGNYIYVVDPHVKNVIVEIDLLLGVAPLEKPQDVMYFRRTFRFVYKNGWKEDGPGISSKK
jgi:hypothetical protein